MVLSPHLLLKRLGQIEFSDIISVEQEQWKNPTIEGVFIITHKELLDEEQSVLDMSLVLLDEAHAFIEQPRSVEKLLGAKYVFAVSATLGDRIGLGRLQKSFGKMFNLDQSDKFEVETIFFPEVNKKEGELVLSIEHHPPPGIVGLGPRARPVEQHVEQHVKQGPVK